MRPDSADGDAGIFAHGAEVFGDQPLFGLLLRHLGVDVFLRDTLRCCSHCSLADK